LTVNVEGNKSLREIETETERERERERNGKRKKTDVHYNFNDFLISKIVSGGKTRFQIRH
jgi:hypothetical protein